MERCKLKLEENSLISQKRLSSGWLFDSFAEDAFLSGEEVFAEEMEKNGTFITIQAAVKVKGSFSVRVSMERIEKHQILLHSKIMTKNL